MQLTPSVVRSFQPVVVGTPQVVRSVTDQSLKSSVIMNVNHAAPKTALGAPRTQTRMEYIPIQKYYTDYEPVITHEQIPYERTYQEVHTTALGQQVEVTKTMTDYQTIQHTNYQPIQVPYTDYKQIEHKTEYVPHVSYETVTEYVPNSKVQQKIEYQPLESQTTVNESTVTAPCVECPKSTEVVVQQSIHEPTLNQPDEHAQQVVMLQQQVIMPQQTRVLNQSYLQRSQIQAVPLTGSLVRHMPSRSLVARQQR